MPLLLPPAFGAPPWFTSLWQRVTNSLIRADGRKIEVIRYDFDKSHSTSATSIGALPANAVLLKGISGVYVHEVFNAGTNNRLDIGTAADTDLYATDLALTALGFVELDETAILFRPSETVATEVKIVVDMTGTAATTGKASVILAYCVLPEG